jgi:hypothetical protein
MVTGRLRHNEPAIERVICIEAYITFTPDNPLGTAARRGDVRRANDPSVTTAPRFWIQAPATEAQIQAARRERGFTERGL